MRRILDAKYEKADLRKVMIDQCQHLSPSKWESLLNILKRFEDVLGGSLGTCNTVPVDLELKDDMKPVCLWQYPVLRVYESIFRKEVERLVKLGVIE